MATLWQQQDGCYMLLWKRNGNNKMAAMRYYVLHLQQYSRRLNLLYFFFLKNCSVYCKSGLSCMLFVSPTVNMERRLACWLYLRAVTIYRIKSDFHLAPQNILSDMMMKLFLYRDFSNRGSIPDCVVSRISQWVPAAFYPWWSDGNMKVTWISFRS